MTCNKIKGQEFGVKCLPLCGPCGEEHLRDCHSYEDLVCLSWEDYVIRTDESQSPIFGKGPSQTARAAASDCTESQNSNARGNVTLKL